jgi:hypothetical protein
MDGGDGSVAIITLIVISATGRGGGKQQRWYC